MNKSCIIAPVHVPKFTPYGIDFISSYNRYFDDEDIFLIFSSKEESNQFKLISKNLKYNSIICDESIGESPITQKKIFGLKYIFNNTDFDKVGAVDVDAIFIKWLDYDHSFEKYIKNKKIYTTHSIGHGNPHVESPIKFFNQEDIAKIRETTHDFKAFFWFNEIPIYYKQHFLDFIKYINYEEIKNKLKHGDFDFIIYSYYLLINNLVDLDFLKINNQIINVPYGLLEYQNNLNTNDFENLVKYINPMWIKTQIDAKYMDNIFMQFHCDRHS
jgi:hypothetical protein